MSLKRCQPLHYFLNDMHLVVYDMEPKKRFDSIYCKRNYEKIITYLNNTKLKKDKYEGYWLNDFNDCIMGVVKFSDKPVAYTGMIMDVKSESISS